MRLPFIALIALATVPVASFAKEGSNGPVPIDPASWFLVEDYPDSALRANEHGTVNFRILVDNIGAPISCKITKSSGSHALDNQSCSSALRRARFLEDTEKSRANKLRRYDGRVTWVIPVGKNGEQPIQSMIMIFTAKLDSQGVLVGCGMKVNDQENKEVIEVCRSMRDTAIRLGIARRADAPDGIILLSETTTTFTGKSVPGGGSQRVH